MILYNRDTFKRTQDMIWAFMCIYGVMVYHGYGVLEF